MSRKKPTKAELQKILEEHGQWVESRGRTGRRADLHGADLHGADLRGADLRAALVHGADFSSANLRGAGVDGANLRSANLQGADLSSANLHDVDLRGANLRGAVLHGADLRGADLRAALVHGADFLDAIFGATSISKVDLSETAGLGGANHTYPCSIGTDTIARSRGQIPEVFLKGCGLDDISIAYAKLYDPTLTDKQITDITYRIDELRGRPPIRLDPVFISYSHADIEFVVALEKRLDKLGVRVWRDEHSMKAGPMDTQIERGIELNPTLILVLSESSIESDWVEWEVGEARKLQKKLEKAARAAGATKPVRHVLCPVALDASWKECNWPGPIKAQLFDKYYAVPFDDWEEPAAFDRQFAKLVDGMDLYYRKGKAK